VYEELGVRGMAKVLSVENYSGPTDGSRVISTYSRSSHDNELRRTNAFNTINLWAAQRPFYGAFLWRRE
jgi:hypothetical protein